MLFVPALFFVSMILAINDSNRDQKNILDKKESHVECLKMTGDFEIDLYMFRECESYIQIWNKFKKRNQKIDGAVNYVIAKQWFELGLNSLRDGLNILNLEITTYFSGKKNASKAKLLAREIFENVFSMIVGKFYENPDFGKIQSLMITFNFQPKDKIIKLDTKKLISYCCDFYIYTLLTENKVFYENSDILQKYVPVEGEFEDVVNKFFRAEQTENTDEEVFKILSSILTVIDYNLTK